MAKPAAHTARTAADSSDTAIWTVKPAPSALLASLAIVASEAAYAWGLTQAKPLRATLPALQLAGFQQLIGGALLLLLSLVFEHRGPSGS